MKKFLLNFLTSSACIIALFLANNYIQTELADAGTKAALAQITSEDSTNERTFIRKNSQVIAFSSTALTYLLAIGIAYRFFATLDQNNEKTTDPS